jgi:hypothetical protein
MYPKPLIFLSDKEGGLPRSEVYWKYIEQGEEVVMERSCKAQRFYAAAKQYVFSKLLLTKYQRKSKGFKYGPIV